MSWRQNWAKNSEGVEFSSSFSRQFDWKHEYININTKINLDPALIFSQLPEWFSFTTRLDQQKKGSQTNGFFLPRGRVCRVCMTKEVLPAGEVGPAFDAAAWAMGHRFLQQVRCEMRWDEISQQMYGNSCEIYPKSMEMPGHQHHGSSSRWSKSETFQGARVDEFHFSWWLEISKWLQKFSICVEALQSLQHVFLLMFQILVLSLNTIFNCQNLFKLISFHIISYHFISFHFIIFHHWFHLMSGLGSFFPSIVVVGAIEPLESTLWNGG